MCHEPKTCPVSKSFKNISVVASLTMVSRVLGLGRDMLVTAVFGTSALASAFYTAFTLPNLFRRLLGEGALTAALVPTLHDELKSGQRAGAFKLVNQVASWLFVVTGGIVVLAMGTMLQAERLAAVAQGWQLILRPLFSGESGLSHRGFDSPAFHGSVLQGRPGAVSSSAVFAVLHQTLPGTLCGRLDHAGDLSGSGARCEAVS